MNREHMEYCRSCPQYKRCRPSQSEYSKNKPSNELKNKLGYVEIEERINRVVDFVLKVGEIFNRG